MVKASQILKTILNNGAIFGIKDLAKTDLSTISVTIKQVSAIRYFSLQGAGQYKLAYATSKDVFFFKNEAQMISSIEILIREGNPLEVADKPLKLDLIDGE